MDRILVLLTTSNYTDLNAIKSYLQRGRNPEYVVYDFSDPAKALSCLSENTVDVILLSVGHGQPLDEDLRFIGAVQTIAAQTPIIVICSASDRHMSDQIIAAGAEDIVRRESFLGRQEDLCLAIGHALARQDRASRHLNEALSLTNSADGMAASNQQNSAATKLRTVLEEGAATLLDTQKMAASKLAASQANAATSLLQVQAGFAEVLKRTHAELQSDFARLETSRVAEADNYRQIYIWMHGGYSFNEYLGEPERQSVGNGEQQLKDAAALKEAQADVARDLLEDQMEAARRLKDDNASNAAGVTQSQEITASEVKKVQE